MALGGKCSDSIHSHGSTCSVHCATSLFSTGGARPSLQAVRAFIDRFFWNADGQISVYICAFLTCGVWMFAA